MKHITIIKVAVALVMMLTPSILKAEKLEIRDSTIIVTEERQTNNLGVLSAIDSISIDEIVLSYKNKKMDTLSIIDKSSKDTIFHHNVTSQMSKEEMEKLKFSLLPGHRYVIRHGLNQWEMTIPDYLNEDRNLEQADSTTTVPSVPEDYGGDNGGDSVVKEYFGLWCCLFGVIGILIGALVVYVLTKKYTDPLIDDGIKKDDRIKKYEEYLHNLAKLLGIDDNHLKNNLIEERIKEILNGSKYKGNVIEEGTKEGEVDSARNDYAKELYQEFQKESVFNELIKQARNKFNDGNPKESEILHNLIIGIADKLNTLNTRSNETNKPEGPKKGSDIDIRRLKTILKGLFDFNYDVNKSVEDNIGLFINSMPEESPDNFENILSERLKKAEAEWRRKSEEDKKDELKKKDSEINVLNKQLGTKDEKINNLNEQLGTKDEKINDLKGTIEKKESEIKELNDSYKLEKQTNIDALVGKLRQYAEKLKWLPILDPCCNDKGTMNQCTDIENRLSEKLKEMKKCLCGFINSEEATPEQTFKAIQDKLVSQIKIEESVINSICRLYAYSKLPFMTDKKREYGVRLRRKNISEIYESLENLYIEFGIKFQLPSLFVMESKDVDYENVTGQVYSELSNLCPNVNNHCDNIDSSMKLKDVIVDIDKIGYTIDGHVQAKARILTF